MNSEIQFETPKTDEESFGEIEILLTEEWKFEGNVFEKDQTYRLVMSKEGEKDKVFHTTKSYPKIFNGHGKMEDAF